MPEVLRREFIYLSYYFSVQITQIFPYWLVGMVLGSLVSVFGKDRIHGAGSGNPDLSDSGNSGLLEKGGRD